VSDADALGTTAFAGSSGRLNGLQIQSVTLTSSFCLQQHPDISAWSLIATKRNPEQFTLPGFYRLLPQLVGSFDPSAGCRASCLPAGDHSVQQAHYRQSDAAIC
jgi:hypothetical protein